MADVLLRGLDFAFLGAHTILIFFNLFGWLWPQTRCLNLLSILLTAGAWIVFAPWMGLGYCPCTDWHWQVKEALGQNNLPGNYLTYLFDVWTGLAVSDTFSERLAWLCLTPALLASIGLNLCDHRRRKKGSKEGSTESQ